MNTGKEIWMGLNLGAYLAISTVDLWAMPLFSGTKEMVWVALSVFLVDLQTIAVNKLNESMFTLSISLNKYTKIYKTLFFKFRKKIETLLRIIACYIPKNFSDNCWREEVEPRACVYEIFA